MKKYLVLTILFGGLFAFNANSQVCDSLMGICQNYMKESTNGSIFVTDGQTHQSFLDGDAAEFQTTLYGGSTYRIATSAGTSDNYVIFTIYDMQGNIIFTNSKFENAPYWDFKVSSTIPCRVEARLDEDKKVSGCVALIIGFQK